MVGYFSDYPAFSSEIMDCTNTGVITASSASCAGGMAGYVRDLFIFGCTNTGKIYYGITEITSLNPMYGSILTGSVCVTSCAPSTQDTADQ
jgi:hypothetical protein